MRVSKTIEQSTGRFTSLKFQVLSAPDSYLNLPIQCINGLKKLNCVIRQGQNVRLTKKMSDDFEISFFISTMEKQRDSDIWYKDMFQKVIGRFSSLTEINPFGLKIDIPEDVE